MQYVGLKNLSLNKMRIGLFMKTDFSSTVGYARDLFLYAILFILFGFCGVAIAAPSDATAPPPIKIGMSTALSGPTQKLGLEMKLGIDVYFAKVNAAGGVDGRQFELIALDDKYEPALAAPNMRQLIDKDQVLAVIGNVGTPPAVVTVPIANEKHVLLFGAFTGAEVLRKEPPDRYVINLRASYEEETAAMVKGLLSIGIKPEELAFFTQNDAYGDSGYAGAMKALKAVGYSNPEALPAARYTRNTLNVEEALAQIVGASKPPKAIIIVGAYAPVAKFIKLVKKEIPNVLTLNVSFVGSAALASELGEEGNNVIVTQVVPLLNVDLPAVREYLEDLKKYGGENAKPSFGSFEGYLCAKLFFMASQRAAAKHELTREGIIDAFENMRDVDIGIDVNVTLSKDNHQALHTVWPTILVNGKYKQLSWPELRNTISEK